MIIIEIITMIIKKNICSSYMIHTFFLFFLFHLIYLDIIQMKDLFFALKGNRRIDILSNEIGKTTYGIINRGIFARQFCSFTRQF